MKALQDFLRFEPKLSCSGNHIEKIVGLVAHLWERQVVGTEMGVGEPKYAQLHQRQKILATLCIFSQRNVNQPFVFVRYESCRKCRHRFQRIVCVRRLATKGVFLFHS